MESLIQQKKRGAKRPGDSACDYTPDGFRAAADDAGDDTAHNVQQQCFYHKPLLPELEVSSPPYNSLLRV